MKKKENRQDELDDRTERMIEIVLALAGVGTGIYGLLTGLLGSTDSVLLIGMSFALYQSTSLAKIIKMLR